jgi:hypothetical protein
MLESQIREPNASADTGGNLFGINICCFRCFSVNGDFCINRRKPQQAKSPVFFAREAPFAEIRFVHPESGKMRAVGKPFVKKSVTGAL